MLKRITTEAYFSWLLISLGLLYLVFNTSLATIYVILIVADFVMYYFNFRPDKKIQFPIENRTDNRLKSFITAIITYGIFLIISTMFLMFTSPQSVSGIGDIMAVITVMSTSVPIFAGSMILSVYAFGILVGSVESSLFFGRVLEKISAIVETRTGKKIRWNEFSGGLVITLLVCMSIFVLYHMGSKGLANVPLMITGIFAVISCMLVLKDGELKSAILLHIFNNTFIILSLFGVI